MLGTDIYVYLPTDRLVSISKMSEQPVTQWIDLVRDGDSLAAHQLWHHYYDRLVRAARQRLNTRQRAVADEEDVVLSVFESFYRAAKDGRFPDLSGRNDLWRLLIKMSSRKVIDRRRHAQRQKRGGGEVPVSLDAGLGDVQGNDDLARIEVVGDEPSPEMVAMMTESVGELLDRLGDGQLREIAVGKMEGYSNAELAQQLKCSERTIERRLNLIREICQQELLSDDDAT